MSQAKEIYWVCRAITEHVTQKIHLLQKYHISVRILGDFLALTKAYAENRLNTIIIGDEGEATGLESPMTKLSNHPEYAGVRFILSVSQSNVALANKAVDLGFRDIIPVDLPDAQWLRRYAFASSGRPTELNAPHPQMSMQALASVQIPGRISWITEKELWLETRLTPPVGTELSISGGLADLMGLKQVRLKVLNRYRSHLHFRYSEALLCRWEVPPAQQVRKLAVQNFMNEQGSQPHYRLYAIVKNRELRNHIVKKLPTDRFQVTVALNKNNMIQEPRFISPDAVLIEDKMCLGPHQPNFEEMLKNLDAKIPVFVLGDAARTIQTPTEHRIVPLTNVQGDLTALFEAELGAPKAVNFDAIAIPKTHALSFANILISARVTSVHPEYIEIASGYPLGRFGLFGVESPLFQAAVEQKVHGKVLDTYESDTHGQLKEFPYRSKALLVDLAKAERESLGRHLVDVFRQQMLPKGQDSTATIQRASEPSASVNLRLDQKVDSIRELSPQDPGLAPIAPLPTFAEAYGAGPMKTEIARSFKDLAADPSPELISIETEVRPLAEQILIDRNYKESPVANFFESLADGLLNIPKEWKIAAVVALGIGLALWVGFYVRQPLEDQAPSFTEQLKIYQHDHGGQAKTPREGEPVETFEP